MDETTPDAKPLTQRFLASLAQFMAHEHQPQGEGDISEQVKLAMDKSKAMPDSPEAEGNASHQTSQKLQA